MEAFSTMTDTPLITLLLITQEKSVKHIHYVLMMMQQYVYCPLEITD